MVAVVCALRLLQLLRAGLLHHLLLYKGGKGAGLSQLEGVWPSQGGGTLRVTDFK